MCGIAGSISRDKPAAFSAAVEAMRHRGPDASGIEQHEVAGWTVTLGHRRLSILDLTEAANQPLTSECGDFTIVFNGEIYNHNALRTSLAAAGHRFRTRSDTEVLLIGLKQEGLSFLGKLNGMFAFALLDKVAGRLILARDPFGIKPLYFHREKDGGLTFASEIRALAVAADIALEVDANRLSEFLLNGFLYEPASGFRGVENVPPGCAYEIELETKELRLHRFNDPLARNSGHSSLEDLLRQQITLEMEADVRVGVFFSGGIDSSVLVATAPREVEAFFVDYGEGEGDARYVQTIADALGTPLQRAFHREDEWSANGIVDEFSEVARGTEQPISDFTYIATRTISRYAREAGYKVMLSGMGGDELFAGYPRHAIARAWPALRKVGVGLSLGADMLGRLPHWSKRAGRLREFLTAPDFAQAYTALIGYFSLSEVTQMTGSSQDGHAALDRVRTLLEPVRGRSALRQAMFLDRHGFLSHNLTVTDRASMSESIEVRVPLLNTGLEAFIASERDSALVKGRSGKLPLKRYLEQRLPHDHIHRPKVGFNPPLDGRIAKLGQGLCQELITTGKLAGYIDPTVTLRWIEEHFSRHANNTYRLWQLIYLNLWLESWS